MNWMQRCKKEAMDLTVETRQAFLDLMWQGKSIGEARDELDITFDAANGIMMINIADVSFLRKVTK